MTKKETFYDNLSLSLFCTDFIMFFLPVQNDQQLYKMLALMDVLRVEWARELKVAAS
jgi:hypothetical protein